MKQEIKDQYRKYMPDLIANPLIQAYEALEEQLELQERKIGKYEELAQTQQKKVDHQHTELGKGADSLLNVRAELRETITKCDDMEAQLNQAKHDLESLQAKFDEQGKELERAQAVNKASASEVKPSPEA